jgi:hypothetical protein
MTLTIGKNVLSGRDLAFFAGVAASVVGTYLSFGVGPLLILGGAATAAAAKFLEVAPCSSTASE